MEAFKTLFWIVVSIFCLNNEGIVVQVRCAEDNSVIIHDINATSAVFECNTRLKVRCYGPKTSVVNWQINNTVNLDTKASAQCYAGFECDIFNNFTGRYSFEYNSSTGISDLTIFPVILQDSMEYKCSDGTLQPLKTSVKIVLGNNLVSLNNVTAGGSLITFNLLVSCTPENVTITWYSMAMDGADYRIHTETSHNETECLAGICAIIGSSKNISSLLELVIVPTNNRRRKRAVEEGRIFGYNVTSESGIVSRWIQGTYKLNEIGCYPEATEPIECWIFGIIVVVIAIVFSVVIIIVIVWYKRKVTTKDVYPCYSKGALIEVAVIIFDIMLITLVVRFVQISKGDCIDSFPCWAILLIVLVVFIILLAISVVVIILDPVRSVTVLSRTIQGETMTVKIQWSARLFHYKKFYADFESEINYSFIKEMNYTSRYDGPLECVISGLSLDNDYQAHVYSKICNIRSLGKTIVFDTKGRALPPESFTEEVEKRTESSVTLKWIPAKGETDHYYIRYKRQKENKEVWKVTPVIKKTYYTVDKLKSGTKYTFQIFAVNSIGHSDESSRLTIRTNAIEAMPPENFEPIEVNANNVKLSWKPSNELKKQVFLLNYLNLADKRTGSEIDGHKITIPYDGKTPMIYTVTDLKPGAKYSIKILTCIGKRRSEYSKEVEIQTKEAIPSRQTQTIKNTANSNL